MSTDQDFPTRKRRSSRLPYAGALLVVGLLVGVAWFGRDRFQPVTAGRPAPEFSATSLAGEPVELTSYRGKVVLVNVWATWCAPCREEMPSMERLYNQVRSQPGGEDFEILAVSVDVGVSTSALEAFGEEFGLTFPIVHDPAGEIQNIYQTTGVPESFVIGRDGIIYKRIAGATTWDAPQYLELIRRLLEA